MKSIRFQTMMLGISLIVLSIQSCTIESASADIGNRSVQSIQSYKPQQNINELFLQKAAEYSQCKISLAKLAKKKAHSIFLKDIAITIEDEHTCRLKELQKFAKKNNITLPAHLNTYDKQILGILAKENDFDKKWTGTLIDKHDMLIFDLASFNTAEQLQPEMKQWIRHNLPHFRSHQDRLVMFDESLRFE